jgi:multiple sugar transport system substrate-binding protein
MAIQKIRGMFSMKKSFICLLVFSFVFMLLAGCGSQEATNDGETVNNESSSDNSSDENNENKEEVKDPVTIKYFTFSAGGTGAGQQEALDAMIAEFGKQNPNINVEYETASYEDYFTKLQTQIAGGSASDTFELNYENFVTYASKGALLNLDSLIQGSGFNPENLNQRAYEAFQYNGSQYGMVESFSNVVLFYNKELFDKYNVEYPQPDWTWEDELEAAKKLTHKDDGVWGTYAPIQFWEFYKTIAQNGGSIFNEDKTQVTINSPENIETLQWMIDKVHKYSVTPSEAEMSGQTNEDLFNSGKIAMLRTGIWMFGYFKDAPFEWDIALEPGNTQKAHHFFANGLAVSKNTEHPEAAWKWIQFMSASKEAAKIRVDHAWELPAVNDPELVEAYVNQTTPASRDVVFEALNSLIVPPVIEEQGKMTDIIGKELEKAKFGEITPSEALANAEEKLKELIK